MKMATTGKKIVIGGAIFAVVAIVFASILFGGITPTGAVINDPDAITLAKGGVQEIKLSFKNYQYELEPSTLQEGVPVRMEVDMNTVTGCMRDVVIPSFGVQQYVSEGNNIIEFTPDKSGTFNIACSMNMGRGTFTVTGTDGTAGTFVEEQVAAAPAGGSCGSGSPGGCGCGGA